MRIGIDRDRGRKIIRLHHNFEPFNMNDCKGWSKSYRSYFPSGTTGSSTCPKNCPTWVSCLSFQVGLSRRFPYWHWYPRWTTDLKTGIIQSRYSMQGTPLTHPRLHHGSIPLQHIRWGNYLLYYLIPHIICRLYRASANSYPNTYRTTTCSKLIRIGLFQHKRLC